MYFSSCNRFFEGFFSPYFSVLQKENKQENIEKQGNETKKIIYTYRATRNIPIQTLLNRSKKKE